MTLSIIDFGCACYRSRQSFGLVIGGEFSASPNDCGLFLNGVGETSANPQCPEYDAWQSYNSTMKQGIESFVMATYDSLQDWFFWTWKVTFLPFASRVPTWLIITLLPRSVHPKQGVSKPPSGHINLAYKMAGYPKTPEPLPANVPPSAHRKIPLTGIINLGKRVHHLLYLNPHPKNILGLPPP
jgi:hypothetical protein